VCLVKRTILLHRRILTGTKELSPKRPDHLWGPPNLLFSGYWCSFPELKRMGRDVDHSTPSSARVKNEWICTSTPLCAFLSWRGTSYLVTWSKACNVYQHCGMWRSQIVVWKANKTKSLEHRPSLKLTFPQLVKKFSTFYRTRRFSIVPSLFTILSHINPIHAYSYLL
jgi:hypothetical protein